MPKSMPREAEEVEGGAGEVLSGLLGHFVKIIIKVSGAFVEK